MVPGVVSIVLAAGVALLMAVFILFGLTRIFRTRRITMADLPELPAPPAGDKGSGPTMQA
jgi:hypothetical protein